MAIQANNSPVSILARGGFASASESLGFVAKQFATGEKYAKPSHNLFATIEAAAGKAKLAYTESARSNLVRLRSMLATRTGALETMRDVAMELGNIALQSSGSIPEDIRSGSVAVFKQLTSRAENIPLTADYSGVKLLDGSFGATSGLESSIKRYNSTVYAPDFAAANAAAGRMAAIGAVGSRTITINANAIENDTLTINGKQLTFKNQADSSRDQIQIGATTAETALNITKALAESVIPELKAFTATVEGEVVTLTRLTNTQNGVTVSASNGDHAVAHIAGGAQPIDTTAAYLDDKMVGAFGELTLISHSVALAPGAAAALASYNTRVEAFGDNAVAGPAAADDVHVKVSFTIGDQKYNGYMFHADGGNTRDMYFIREDKDTGVVSEMTGYVGKIRFSGDTELTDVGPNFATLKTGFETDTASMTMKQARVLNVLGSYGEFKNGSSVVGSSTGMSAFLTTSSFGNLKVSSVAIDDDKVLTVKIADAQNNITSYTATLSDITSRGTSIELSASNGDVLTLGVGTKDLNVSTKENREIVASSLKRVLGSEESKFIVGTDVTQTLSLDLGDMRWANLVGDLELDVSSQVNARIATDKLDQAVDRLNAEIALTAAYDKAIDTLIAQTQVSQQNLAAAVDEISTLDIPATRLKLDSAIRTTAASMAAMNAQKQIDNMLQDLLRG